MAGLFTTPKPVKMPPVPPTPIPPEVSPESEDIMRRRLRARSGYQKTILTGDLVPEPQKKMTLG